MSTFARVDFPHPDSPTTATVSASRAARSTHSLALTGFVRLLRTKAPSEPSFIS